MRRVRLRLCGTGVLGKASAELWRGFSLVAIGSLNMWRGVVPGSEQVGCPQVRLLGVWVVSGRPPLGLRARSGSCATGMR